MKDINDEELEHWKATFAKDGIVYYNDEDYRGAINDLMGFFKVLIDIDRDFKDNRVNENNKEDFHLIDKDGNKIIL